MSEQPLLPVNSEGERADSNLELVIREEITRAGGRITLARFMDLALYHADYGYYLQEERRPGRTGDFLTSPEASPLFGLTLARQMSECWERIGKPPTWTIREYGSGIGGLAYDILAGLSRENPAAFDAVRYEMVEVSAPMRDEANRSMEGVGLEHRVDVLPPHGATHAITGVLLANEVADAMPVHRLVVKNGSLVEHWVGLDGDGFGWTEGAVSDGARGYADLLPSGLPEGSVLDISPAAGAWFATALDRIERGFSVVIDYGYEATELFAEHRLDGTMRGYRGHTVTDNPLIMPGQQDLTAHVDFTRLIEAGTGAGWRLEGLTTQGAFLSSLGLGDFLLDLQRDPETTTEEYYATQAVVLRLIDPGGLGRFRVLMMAKGVPSDGKLRGMLIEPPGF